MWKIMERVDRNEWTKAVYQSKVYGIINCH